MFFSIDLKYFFIKKYDINFFYYKFHKNKTLINFIIIIKDVKKKFIIIYINNNKSNFTFHNKKT